MKWKLKLALFKYEKTVSGLARFLEVNRNTASAWANSKTMPKIDQKTLEGISKYLGCPISEFLILDDETDFKSPRQGAGKAA